MLGKTAGHGSCSGRGLSRASLILPKTSRCHPEGSTRSDPKDLNFAVIDTKCVRLLAQSSEQLRSYML